MKFAGGVDLGTYSRASLTYTEHGATRGALPAGYHHVVRRERIGSGTDTFATAVEALNQWRMHTGAGLVVVSAPPTAEVDSTVVMRLGPPVVGLLVPCRVVYVVDEPDRGGFAYGTLPGHPEQGEEAFLVEIGADDDVWVQIRAFSRPATLLVRLGGPANRAVQRLMTDRYIRTLRRLGNGPQS